MSAAQCTGLVASLFVKSSSPKMVSLIYSILDESYFHSGNLRHDLSVNCWTSSQQIKRQRHPEVATFLTDLPNEILFHVMSNLDNHALKNVRKTSKKLFYLTETFVGYGNHES